MTDILSFTKQRIVLFFHLYSAKSLPGDKLKIQQPELLATTEHERKDLPSH